MVQALKKAARRRDISQTACVELALEQWLQDERKEKHQ